MDYNHIGETLLQGSILLMGRRSESQILGKFSPAMVTQKQKLSAKALNFASSLSPYDTLEFNYGDQKVVLYRLSNNILVLTLNAPRIDAAILEKILPQLKNTK